MSTTRRRRIRAHTEQLRAQETHRRRGETTQVEQIRRFDDALPKLMAWIAIAVFVLIAVVTLVA